MANIRKLASLFHAVSVGDWPRSRQLAEAIAETEERAGHHGAAATLRGALAQTGPRPDEAQDRPDLLSLAAIQPDVLTKLPASVRLRDVRLPAAARSVLEDIVKEHRHRERLLAHDLSPRCRLFFFGSPGCGKTLTARALGAELGLPVFVVRFDTLIGSYLGQTSLRIRDIFRFAETQPCVTLIDEIDAVGRQRGKTTDVGELDRVVISLMQQLDLVRPAGLIVAASNMPEHLDPALLRRFDLSLEFPVPTTAEIQAFAKVEAKKRGVTLINGVKRDLTLAKTFADAEQIIQLEHRRIVLQGV
jgi:SpoVK/Ycf46/Vps4 family AAA+-type ATPase